MKIFSIKTILLLSVAVLSAGLANAASKTVKPSGSAVSKSYNITSVTGISLSSQGIVYYEQGKTTSVKVKATQTILDILEIVCKDGLLSIGFKKDVSVKMDNDDLIIYVTAPNVKKLSLSGSGDIKVNSAISIDKLDIDLSGSGDIKFNGVTATNITANVAGSGDIDFGADTKATNINFNVTGSGNVECDNPMAENVNCTVSGSGDIKMDGGKATNASLSVNGSGDISAHNMETQTVQASTSGSGDITCNSKETLDSSISGSGSVKYSGSPTTVNTSGNSTPSTYNKKK